MLLPCGKCIGCRLHRSKQWALRCVHESKMHEFNCFITLTYNEDNLPYDGSLNYKHFQLFMKRLRKAVGVPVRFYMCGEYGELNGRPHYHALLFGYDFPDKVLFGNSGKSPIYRSAQLDSLWGLGFASVGECNFESAAYIARYVMKKVTGDKADDHYRRIVPETGEIVSIVPEFTRMSLKPGIGGSWFDKFHADVFPHDRVVFNAVKHTPPTYYFRLLKRRDVDMYEAIRAKHLDFIRVDNDNTPARRRVKGIVTEAKVSFYKRSI